MLRHHDRQHLGVQRAVVQPDDAVDADREQRTGRALEDRGAEGPPVPRTTFCRASSIASRIRSSSVVVARAEGDGLVHPLGPRDEHGCARVRHHSRFCHTVCASLCARACASGRRSGIGCSRAHVASSVMPGHACTSNRIDHVTHERRLVPRVGISRQAQPHDDETRRRNHRHELTGVTGGVKGVGGQHRVSAVLVGDLQPHVRAVALQRIRRRRRARIRSPIPRAESAAPSQTPSLTYSMSETRPVARRRVPERGADERSRRVGLDHARSTSAAGRTARGAGSPRIAASSLMTARIAREMMLVVPLEYCHVRARRGRETLARRVESGVRTSQQHDGHVRDRIPGALVELAARCSCAAGDRA